MPSTYSIADIGTLGGTITQAVAINDMAGIVGWGSHRSDAIRPHAFLYTHENGIQDIGLLPKGTHGHE